ncbi:hypothetical protein HPB47_011941 [Ixodes persulcatus]|uniref:Uncharacterized protein n=1 Tax=Ixodes persulcatus TaxID=34615 RepID=A0AC60NV05_IXOPE|nr:hypothetical protein HPB47_011941 [Ixodes persulcatus]
MDALRLRTTVQRSGPRISCVVSYLQENNLKLLTGVAFCFLHSSVGRTLNHKDGTLNNRKHQHPNSTLLKLLL